MSQHPPPTTTSSSARAHAVDDLLRNFRNISEKAVDLLKVSSDRLASLDDQISPIHVITQEYQKTFVNIGKVRDRVLNTIQQYERATAVEAQVSYGMRRDFQGFIKASEKIPQILAFFEMHSDYDNADVIYDRLQRSLKRAITECEEDFTSIIKKTFDKSGVCDDAKRFVSGGGSQAEADSTEISVASDTCSPAIVTRLRAVQKLYSQLVGADASSRMADLFVAVNAHAVRRDCVTEQIASFYAVLSPSSRGGQPGDSQKDSSRPRFASPQSASELSRARSSSLDTIFQSQIFTFSVLAVTFVFSARSELELSRFVFEGESLSLKHRTASRVTDHLVIGSMIDMVDARLKQEARPESLLFLVEAHSILSTAVTQILANLGVHAEEELELKLGELLKRATQIAISALWATFQQLKFGSSKVVPKDGTVHEVTSLYVQRAHKMSILEKQLDGVIESMTTLRVVPLADPPVASYSEFVATWGWLGRGSQGAIDELHHCIVDAIDQRAKLYKSDAKRAAVFLLNNHHYVFKTLCAPDEPIASHTLCDLSRVRVDGLRVEIEKLWWQPLLKILHDTFSITPKASLPTKEKEALKKAFGGFNTGFEQVFTELKQMTIPSTALRSDVVASIGDEVVPVYTVFYNRFAQLDFSKKRDTYTRYTPSVLADMIKSFFSSTDS